MSISVNTRWTQSFLSKQEPWTGQKVYDVVGEADSNIALADTRLAQVNDPWAPGWQLISLGPRVIERPGTYHYVVQSDFRIRQPITPTSTDPNAQGTDIEWEQVELTLPVDSDLDGRPLLYANGEKIEGETRTIKYDRLHLTKNFPFFNRAWTATWLHSVNQAGTMFGGYLFPSQHLYCAGITPTAKYSLTRPPKFLPVRWTFDCIPDDMLGPYPFQHRVANQGTMGWDADDELGLVGFAKFTSHMSNGWVPVESPVRLTLSGKPIPTLYPGVKVSDGNDPIDNPNIPEKYDASGFPSPNVGFWLYFKKVRLADFSGIPL